MKSYSLTSIVALFLFSCFVTSCEQSNNQSGGSTKIDHVDATGALALLTSGSKPVILDVRTKEEFESGHIEGATMIDFKSADFEEKVSELDRQPTYLIHCRSGRRSTSSLPVFEKLGFEHIIHLDGGFNAWQENGNPVVGN